MDIIRKLNREQGVTVIVVTHEVDIGAYADRMIVMRDGQILSDEHQTAVAASDRSTPSHDRRGDNTGGQRFTFRRRLRFSHRIPVDDLFRLFTSSGEK